MNQISNCKSAWISYIVFNANQIAPKFSFKLNKLNLSNFLKRGKTDLKNRNTVLKILINFTNEKLKIKLELNNQITFSKHCELYSCNKNKIILIIYKNEWIFVISWLQYTYHHWKIEKSHITVIMFSKSSHERFSVLNTWVPSKIKIMHVLASSIISVSLWW